MTETAPAEIRVKPSALKQTVGMTLFLGVCGLAAYFLEDTTITDDTKKAGLGLVLSLGLLFSAWRYGPSSPALGAFACWIVIGIFAAYTLG